MPGTTEMQAQGTDMLVSIPNAVASRVRTGFGEEDLVRRLRAGDEDAQARLVEANLKRLLAVANRILRNSEEAQDAVHDAFLSAFQRIDTFEGEARLSTWLHRIVVNSCLVKLRRHRRRSAHEERILHESLQGTRGEYRPESEASRREIQMLIRETIDRLPPAHRSILRLRALEELGTDEAARRLGVSRNAVKVRFHRACVSLRALLESRSLDRAAS